MVYSQTRFINVLFSDLVRYTAQDIEVLFYRKLKFIETIQLNSFRFTSVKQR